MPARSTSPVSVETKKAILAMRSKGFTNAQIAERVGIHEVTVSRICSSLRKQADAKKPQVMAKATPEDELKDWRDRIKKKSIKALENGLDCADDPYRQGALGRDALKGLGEFNNDSVLDLIVVKFLASYATKPIYIFGGFGFFSLFVAFASFVLMMYFKVMPEPVHRDFVETPLPIVITMFVLVGFLSMLMGLLAELTIRTYYESQGKRTYALWNGEEVR